jgi:hypothetical protein
VDAVLLVSFSLHYHGDLVSCNLVCYWLLFHSAVLRCFTDLGRVVFRLDLGEASCEEGELATTPTNNPSHLIHSSMCERGHVCL